MPAQGSSSSAGSQILPLLERVVARARKEGALRDDFTIGDLSVALWSFAPVFEATKEVAPDAWRRHLRILLDGMRPGRGDGADGAPALEARSSRPRSKRSADGTTGKRAAMSLNRRASGWSSARSCS